MLLQVTSPHMTGPDVRVTQWRLALLGYSPGSIDGDYGPTTASAVQRFQASHSLQPDGIVGDVTYAALMASGAQPQAPQTSDIGAKALAEAIKHLGLTESPSGSNKTPFGEWFGVNGVAWCNIFVSYCYNVGAGYTICDGYKGAGVKVGKGCAYVPTTEAWLRSSGLWVGRTTPIAGDIAIYNWDGKGIPEHIGVVEQYLGNGTFSAIEGNTSIGNDSNGGEVMRRTRKITSTDGFGRVI
ncbi:CHAP domain containing protein [uncultured Caudovirales phage]|uniref:CHAP domain containing protein n=1 Tax=uncultured Caudovirales phage TaxID=2100421 RepID=A0A6J5LND2_9CAUD|nr:CHAP domain containing protein [uncultured Caudovirales phage]CAB4134853.1 CHAP domain containing protein [uncultured Caudovirales phage]